jgi:hypothetical protein
MGREAAERRLAQRPIFIEIKLAGRTARMIVIEKP